MAKFSITSKFIEISEEAQSLLSSAQNRAEEFFNLHKEEFRGISHETLQEKLEQLLHSSTILCNAKDRMVKGIEEVTGMSLPQFFEENDLPEEEDQDKVSNLVSSLIVKRSEDLSIFVGRLYASCKGDQNQIDRIWSFLEKSGIVESYGKNGTYVVPCSEIQFSDEDCKVMEILQPKLPLICSPNKVRGSQNGFKWVKESTWTNNGGKTHNSSDFLNRQNAVCYKINWELWEDYIKFLPEIPDDSEEEDFLLEEEGRTHEEFVKCQENSRRKYFKKVFLCTFYKLLGIDYIWVCNQFDYRGRNYPIGWVVTTQGTDPDKALLQFSGSKVTKKGLIWLARSVANCHNEKFQGKSLDKCNWSERDQWFEERITPLLSLKREEFKEKIFELSHSAEMPGCFISQALDYYQAWHSIQLLGVGVSYSICHWDATSSGYGIMALLTKDPEMGQLTNLWNAPNRVDFYSEIGKKLGLDIPRSLLKKVIMTAGYGSERSLQKLEDYQPGLRQKFEDFMNQYPAWVLNRKMLSWYQKGIEEYSWTLPDGFEVFKEISRTTEKNISLGGDMYSFSIKEKGAKVNDSGEFTTTRELGPNFIHSVDSFIAREISRRMAVNTAKKSKILNLLAHPELWSSEKDEKEEQRVLTFLETAEKFNYYSAKVLSLINERTAHIFMEKFSYEDLKEFIDEFPEESHDVSEIHDSFGVDPEGSIELMQQYRCILRDILVSNILTEVVKELEVKNPQAYRYIDKENLEEKIMKSEYALC